VGVLAVLLVCVLRTTTKNVVNPFPEKILATPMITNNIK